MTKRLKSNGLFAVVDIKQKVRTKRRLKIADLNLLRSKMYDIAALEFL